VTSVFDSVQRGLRAGLIWSQLIWL